MIIKPAALEAHLKKQHASIYIFTGLDPYLLQQSVLLIKKAWKQLRAEDGEETILHIQQPTDWAQSIQNANSYSLFANYRLLDLRFDKKTLDAVGKNQLKMYLEAPNPRTLILIQAPHIPASQLQLFANDPNVVHTHIMPLTGQSLKNFVTTTLQKHALMYDPDVPELIFQYNQNNVLACNQLIEQLAMVHPPSQSLTTTIVMDYIADHGDFSIYELGDACLNAETSKAIHILRQISCAQGEPTLILWLFAQEIRRLIQLKHLLKQSIAFNTACQQLKIWSQKVALYQKAIQRLSVSQLYTLLGQCQQLDEQIKSSRAKTIWLEFESLIITITASTHR